MPAKPQPKTWQFIFVFCVIPFMLYGCPPGGGSEPDTTAPQVIDTLPANLQTDVTPHVNIAATFDETMDWATISTGSVTISPAVTGTVSYNGLARQAIFTPGATLAESTTYTVTITTACTDSAGNPLAANYIWSFTTGSTANNSFDQVGTQVSPAGAESEDPTMMIVDGTPIVGYRHASYEINLNQWNGSVWGASAPDPSGGYCSTSLYQMPDFYADRGIVYMAYERSGDSALYSRIFVHQWTPSGGWSVMNGGNEVSAPYASDGGIDAYEPAVTCYPGEPPQVAWVESDLVSATTEYHSWVAEVTASGSTPSAALSRNTGDHTTVYTTGIVTTILGCSYIAHWESNASDPPYSDLYVTYYCSGSFVNLGGAIATDTYNNNYLSKPSIVIMDAELYIAYTQGDPSGSRDVYVKKYELATNSWVTVGSGPITAFTTGHYDSGNPQLAAVDGVLYVAWDESDVYSGPFIYVAYYDAGASDWVIFGDQLNIGTSSQALDPSLAYDPATGYVYVAFEDNFSSGWQIYVKRKRHIP